MTSRIKKLSDKRLKELGGKPMFSTIRKKKRPESKTARIYGSKARRDWVKLQPCAACGVEGFSVNAHVAPPSEKGTGYKASAKWIVPLCVNRWPLPDTVVGIVGCHTLHDEYPDIFAHKHPDFDATRAAQETEKAWQESQK